jgi:hypothetical protein
MTLRTVRTQRSRSLTGESISRSGRGIIGCDRFGAIAGESGEARLGRRWRLTCDRPDDDLRRRQPRRAEIGREGNQSPYVG